MATIHKEITVGASVDEVWDALRDVGAIHERLARGVVADTELEEGQQSRIVTFANGFTVRERIVTIDDATHRLAYTAVGGRATHHNSSVQLFPSPDGGTRVVWITDLLPDDVAPLVSGLVEQVSKAMKETLDGAARSHPR
jgi:carbon monoxide dehydrogenase subunit G